jgi:hypothetical protein
VKCTVTQLADGGELICFDERGDAAMRWIHRVGDLGEVDEDLLIAGWRPDGRWRVTEDSDCTVDAGGVLTMTCATPRALIG